MTVDATFNHHQEPRENENENDVNRAGREQRFIDAEGDFLNLPRGAHDFPHGDQGGE